MWAWVLLQATSNWGKKLQQSVGASGALAGEEDKISLIGEVD